MATAESLSPSHRVVVMVVAAAVAVAVAVVGFLGREQDLMFNS